MARNEVTMTLDQAESYVSKTPAARWDGWKIVLFSPNRAAWTKRDGRFHNGVWGFETVVGVCGDGMYRVPRRFAGTDV
jgi:hypothetical protein